MQPEANPTLQPQPGPNSSHGGTPDLKLRAEAARQQLIKYAATPRGRIILALCVLIPCALLSLVMRKPPAPPVMPESELMLPSVPVNNGSKDKNAPQPTTATTITDAEHPNQPGQVVQTQAKNPLDATVEVALSQVPLQDEITTEVVQKQIDAQTAPLKATIEALKEQIVAEDRRIQFLSDRMEDMRQQHGDGNLPAHKLQIVKYELIEDSLKATVEARLYFIKTDDDPVFYKVKSGDNDHQVVLEVSDSVVTAQAPQPISFLKGVQTKMEGSMRKFIFSSDSQIEPQVKLTGNYLSVNISQVNHRATSRMDSSPAAPGRAYLQNDDRSPSAKGIAAAWVVKAITRDRALLFNRELRQELNVQVGDDVPYSGKVLDVRPAENTVRTTRDVIAQG